MQLRWFLGGNLKWASALVVVAAAVLALGSSLGSAGALGQVVFTTGPDTLTAGTVSPTMTVQLQDSNGQPVNAAGATTIQLSTDSSGGGFRAADGTTPITQVVIGAGQSSADFTYVDTKAGTPTLTAADSAGSAGFGSTTQQETVNPGAASMFEVDAPASTTAGNDVAPVTVKAEDAYGNVDPTYNGTISFSSSDPHAVLPANYTFTTGTGADDGMHVFSASDGIVLKTTPSQTLSVADTQTGSKNGTSASITVNPGPLASFAWTSEPSRHRAGQDLQASVTAYDAYGNIKTDYNGSNAQITGLHDAPDNSHPSYGTWSNGVDNGPFVDYRTEPTGTTLVVTDTASVPNTTVTQSSSSFVVDPAAIGSFTWSQPGPTQKAGVDVVASVTAYDTYGNVKTDYTASTATKSGLQDAPNGSKTASYGTWSNGVDNGPFDTYQTATSTAISFVDGSATGGTSSGFSVDPGPLGSFQWTSEPTSPHVAGASFGGAVTAYDTFGNVKTDYDGTAAQYSGLHDGPTSGTATYVVNWSGGVGSGTFTGYRTEPSPGTNLVVSDSTSTTSTISAQSSNVVITPAALGSFSWTTQPHGTYIAGGAIAAAVTAKDIYGNTKTDYATASASFGGLSGAPNTHPPNPNYGSFSAGVDSGPFNSYTTDAAGSTQITVTDTASSITATSNAFGITPAALGSFTWTTQPTGTYVAGSAIGAAVTAYDIYGNVKTDYATSSAQFSGLKGAPNNQPQNPSYGGFANGVDGSFASFTNDLTNSTRITVADAGTPSIAATSNAFGITPADPGTVTFGTQPSETQVNVAIAPPVTVNVVDIYGNPGSFEQVTMALNRPSTGGATSFTGASTTSVVADANGTAAFSNLAVGTVAIGYKMTAKASRIASSPITATKQSGPFTIAQTVNPCNTQNCSGNANDPNNSSAQVVGSVQTNSNTLGIALTLNAPARPANACPTFRDAPGADGSFVNVNTVSTGTTKPNLTITWTIAKALVNKIPISPNNFNNGTSHYDVCLGAAYIDPNSTPHGFPTKNGGTAVPVVDPVTGITFYWGIIPDCPKKGASLNPCMVSRGKDANGNLILTYFVPFPYDPTGWAGGGI